jgi:hypothetical protein
MDTPCQHRTVLDDGRITCQRITGADNEVSPDICLHCPAAACGCLALKFSLEKVALTPIIVRWADGRAEVWDNQPPHVSFLRSSCALRKTPVRSPEQCLGCPLRQSPASTSTDPVVLPAAGPTGKDNVIPFVRRLTNQPGVPSRAL